MLPDYFFSEATIKPSFTCILPEQYCDCIEISFGLVYYGMHKTSAGFDAHRLKFYIWTDIASPDDSDGIRRSLDDNKCDGSREPVNENGSSFGYCRSCGIKVFDGQHIDC